MIESVRVEPSAYDDQDARATIRNLPDWWGLLSAQDGDGRLGPGQKTLTRALEQAARALGAAAPGHGTPLDGWTEVVLSKLTGSIDGVSRTVLDELLVEALETISEAGRLLHHARPSLTGTLAQINTSGGGVPKLPVDTAEVGSRGLLTDVQRTRKHHGRPWQALCLWSSEVIDAFAAQGHPIGPGAAGENFTLSGIDWAEVAPGQRLAIGPDVVAELTMWALPCRHNAQWFSDGRFDLMHHRHGPVSRIYASVLQPGRVKSGDRVTLEP